VQLLAVQKELVENVALSEVEISQVRLTRHG